MSDENKKKTNKEKRELKNDPKLKLVLNEEQKQVKADFYEKDVNFIIGDFGSGKTLLATEIALSCFRKKQYNQIIIVRPIVQNKLGYLPGEIIDKLAPWIAPIVHNFNQLQNKSKTEKMLRDSEIQILPIDFAKGITYIDSVVIIDEFQDMDYTDFRTMLTRLGKDSKIIFTGSEEQIDRSIGTKSCMYKIKALKDSGLVAYNKLKSNHRNPILTEIVKYLEE